MKAEQIFLTVLFVIFKERIWFQSFGKSTVPSRLWSITKRTGFISWIIGTARKSTSRQSLSKYTWAWVEESSGMNWEKVTPQYQGLTSQMQELQERMIFVNDSEECQDKESICTGKLSHVPSQPVVVPSPRAMASREQSLRPDTWNLSGTRKCYWQSACRNRFIPDTSAGNSSLLESKCCRWEYGRLIAKGEDGGCIHRVKYMLNRWWFWFQQRRNWARQWR